MKLLAVSIVLALLTVTHIDAYSSKKWGDLIPSFKTNYIINGKDAAPNSAPYIVSLSASSLVISHICGGTIIDKNWVLTAAHCIENAIGMGVVAGLHERLSKDNGTTQLREVDFGKLHESYGGGIGPHDIALLHVSEPFVFNKCVQPAVLPSREEIHSGEVHLYGWGLVKVYPPVRPNILQTVQTKILDWDTCKRVITEAVALHWNHICSDSLQKGIAACTSDSGGPLVKEYENAPSELIGIVAWGFTPCGETNLPTIYTRVSAYIPWISSIKYAYYMLN